ncbi:sulfurtransferase TusA family protein [Bacillus massilinigeriensis]|uniref:sulfurtransferase TusA family protein n=1 Tax=Bacillus mediterraneensis TaxID=1805474 RepID=UPI0024AEBABF|nr:sulfurtransferase TusA family protein [Bacillus mediterraneensis]
MYALDALKEMKAGELLQIIVGANSCRSVPEEAKKHGYELVTEPEKVGPDFYIYIRVPK